MSVNMGTAYAELVLDSTKFDLSLAESRAKLKTFKDQTDVTSSAFKTAGGVLTKTGGILTKSVTLPVLGLGAAALKTTADFDSAMSKVSAISGATGGDFDKLRAKAREMGAKTKFSATEAAEAMNYMAMAGWKTSDMLGGIEGIMNLAAASGEDLATTSDIVTDALTAFGKSASDSGRLADIMASASANANTNVSMLGESFKYVAPVAGALNFTMEDTATALGLMANSGIKASQAGTSMRAWMTNLTKPTGQVAGAMKELGLSITDSEGNMKSLRTIMQETRGAFSNLSESQKAQYAATLAGQEGMSGLLAIVNSSEEDFNKLAAAIDNSSDKGGTAAAQAATMQKNLSGQVTILKSALQELAISVGDVIVPVFAKFVAKVQALVDWLNSLDKGTKETVVKIGLIAAAIGPLLLAGGKILTFISSAISGWASFAGWAAKAAESFGWIAEGGTVLEGLQGAIAGIVSAAAPIVAVVAAIAALVIGLKEAYENNAQVKAQVDEAIAVLQENLQPLLEFFANTVVPNLRAAWQSLQDMLQPLADFLGGMFASMWTDIIVPALNMIATVVLPQVTATFEHLWNAVLVPLGTFIGTVLQPTFSVLATVLTFLWQNVVVPMAQGALPLFAAAFSALSTGINFAITIIGGIIKILTTLWNTVLRPITAFISGVFAGAFMTAFAVIGSAVKSVQKVLSGLITFFTGVFTGNWKKAWEGVKKITQGVVDGIVGIIDGVKNAFKAAGDIIGKIKGAVIGGSSGSHADGLAYVPYDGYRATLHEGERVLTRNEAKEYDGGGGRSYSFTYNSPKAVDPYEANKLFKQSIREVEEGFA